jgi:hypothetical protein
MAESCGGSPKYQVSGVSGGDRKTVVLDHKTSVKKYAAFLAESGKYRGLAASVRKNR